MGPGRVQGGPWAGSGQAAGPGPGLGLQPHPRDGVVGHLVGRICKRNPTLISEVNFSSGFVCGFFCEPLRSGIAFLKDKKSTKVFHQVFHRVFHRAVHRVFHVVFHRVFHTAFQRVFHWICSLPIQTPPVEHGFNRSPGPAQGPPRPHPGPARSPPGARRPGPPRGPPRTRNRWNRTKINEHIKKIHLIRSIHVKSHTNPRQIVASPLKTNQKR